MPFFLLQADTQGTSLEPDPPAGSVRAMVVLAADEAEARDTATANMGTEGEHTWSDPGSSMCREIDPEGGPACLLRAFNA